MKVRSKRKQTRQQRVYVVASIFAVIIIAAVLLPKLFSSVTVAIMRPVHSFNSWIQNSESTVPVFVRDRQSLVREIVELEQALSERSGTETSRQYLARENEELRALLQIEHLERVAAAVVARPNELPYDVLQLDRGSEAGIEIGSPVYINDHVAIGLVVYTTPTYSLVELISSPDFRSTVFIGGPNVLAELVGQGNGSARVRVPQGIALSIGDTVSLPSIDTAVFGRIVSIESVSTQAEQYGYVTLPISLQQLHIVSVGRPVDVELDPEAIKKALESELRQRLLISNIASSSLDVENTEPETSSSTDVTTTP